MLDEFALGETVAGFGEFQIKTFLFGRKRNRERLAPADVIDNLLVKTECRQYFLQNILEFTHFSTSLGHAV